MNIGILDQSPIIRGHTPAQALRETSRLRVGTGGVLLPYYSAFKVAEQFRMLEALYPGRIDLGIGRAPGGDRLTALAVAEGRSLDAESFPEQVRYLAAYLAGRLPNDHPLAEVRAMPTGGTMPQIWLLGSSDYSGALAAQLGLRFAFAHFINARGGDVVMRDYRARYQPSTLEPAPQSLLCVFVICAETDAEAQRLTASINLRRLNMDYGINAPVPDHEEAAAYPYTAADRARIAQHARRIVAGTPDAVRTRLAALKAEAQADELMVITITGDYASRRRSYELVAEAFELQMR